MTTRGTKITAPSPPLQHSRKGGGRGGLTTPPLSTDTHTPHSYNTNTAQEK